MDPFLGQIILFGGNFAPVNWAFCNGQFLPINQYTALYSLLGTTYGGNGQTTFALPDLRSRVPIGWGTTPFGSNYPLGQQGGIESVTVTLNEMAQHAHSVAAGASTSDASTGTPANAVFAVTGGRGGGTNIYTPTANASLAAVNSATAGGSQPHENRQPCLAMNFIICTNGLFPPRS